MNKLQTSISRAQAVLKAVRNALYALFTPPSLLGAALCTALCLVVLSCGYQLTTRVMHNSVQEHEDSLEIRYDIIHSGMDVATRTTTYLSSSTSPATDSYSNERVDGRSIVNKPTTVIRIYDSADAAVTFDEELARRKHDTVIITKRYTTIVYKKNLGTWRRR